MWGFTHTRAQLQISAGKAQHTTRTTPPRSADTASSHSPGLVCPVRLPRHHNCHPLIRSFSCPPAASYLQAEGPLPQIALHSSHHMQRTAQASTAGVLSWERVCVGALGLAGSFIRQSNSRPATTSGATPCWASQSITDTQRHACLYRSLPAVLCRTVVLYWRQGSLSERTIASGVEVIDILARCDVFCLVPFFHDNQQQPSA